MRERERALLHSHNVTWGLDLGLKIPPNPTVLQTRFFFTLNFSKEITILFYTSFYSQSKIERKETSFMEHQHSALSCRQNQTG
jgi:hypothetical protein